MKTIIFELFGNTTFTEAELQLMYSSLQKIELKKKTFLLRAEREIHDVYYVHEGCLRSYFIDAAGKEHILQFAIKGWWISDYIALFGKEKSKAVCNIECLKDATLYKISKKDFDEICKKIPKIAHVHIEKLEYAFAAFQKRILENLTLSAKERYLNFITTYPNIEQSVKNYHIASYLGITTESLSRIRKEIIST